MNTLKEIVIGVFTGLLLTVFVFAMVTEASTGLMAEDAEGRIYSTQTGYFTVHGKADYELPLQQEQDV